MLRAVKFWYYSIIGLSNFMSIKWVDLQFHVILPTSSPFFSSCG